MNGDRYGDINHNELDSYMGQLDTLFMDGCSMPHHNFVGAIMVAAPPSVSTVGLRKAIPLKNRILYMPPWSEKEQLAVGDLLEVDEDILKENYKYKNTILRCAFQRDDATTKVESALKEGRQAWFNLQVGGVEPFRH